LKKKKKKINTFFDPSSHSLLEVIFILFFIAF
jgi:hypothetical protein